jgi:mutual gliding-motility protein MglA
MPTISHARKEVLLKIVYYGPGLGGKTTNLEYVHAHTRPDMRGKLLSLRTETERTLFFDLLPVDLGHFKGYGIRLHLCTVPGQIAYDNTRRMILRHVDGVVFVVDSQPATMESNYESLANLATNLRLQGEDPDRVPVVVQFNKRDLPGVMPADEIRMMLGIPQLVPSTEASAKYGQGVFETLKRIVTECMKLTGDPRRAAEGRTPSIMPGRRASMYPEARPRALRSGPPPGVDHEPVIPRAPKIPSIRRR